MKNFHFQIILNKNWNRNNNWEKNWNNNIIINLSNNFYFHLLFWRLPDNFVSLLGFPENFHFYVYVLNMKISEKKFFIHFHDNFIGNVVRGEKVWKDETWKKIERDRKSSYEPGVKKFSYPGIVFICKMWNCFEFRDREIFWNIKSKILT